MNIEAKKIQLKLAQEQLLKEQILVALYDAYQIGELEQAVTQILIATGYIQNDTSEADEG